MRWILISALLLPVLSLLGVSAAFAQRSSSSTGTYGNILHPGVPSSAGPGHTPTPPPRSPGYRGGVRRPVNGGTVYVPYPIYTQAYGTDGGYYVGSQAPGGYDPIFGGYGPAQPLMPPTPPAPPTVVINQNFQADTVRPQFRDYTNTPLPPPGAVMVPPSGGAAGSGLADDQPTIFLIAMEDHTILPAIAYWVQGDILNYISVQGAPNHVSLSLVDREFSKQLNAERNIPFALPAAR